MKGSVKMKHYCSALRAVIPPLVCVNTARLQGCTKKGCKGCFATRARGEVQCLVFAPKGTGHPGCFHAAEQASAPSSQAAGTQRCSGSIMDPGCPGRAVSASADAEYGPFLPKSQQYFILS